MRTDRHTRPPHHVFTLDGRRIRTVSIPAAELHCRPLISVFCFSRCQSSYSGDWPPLTSVVFSIVNVRGAVHQSQVTQLLSIPKTLTASRMNAYKTSSLFPTNTWRITQLLQTVYSPRVLKTAAEFWDLIQGCMITQLHNYLDYWLITLLLFQLINNAVKQLISLHAPSWFTVIFGKDKAECGDEMKHRWVTFAFN